MTVIDCDRDWRQLLLQTSSYVELELSHQVAARVQVVDILEADRDRCMIQVIPTGPSEACKSLWTATVAAAGLDWQQYFQTKKIFFHREIIKKL